MLRTSKRLTARSSPPAVKSLDMPNSNHERVSGPIPRALLRRAPPATNHNLLRTTVEGKLQNANDAVAGGIGHVVEGRQTALLPLRFPARDLAQLHYWPAESGPQRRAPAELRIRVELLDLRQGTTSGLDVACSPSIRHALPYTPCLP
eukprot:scaffold680_cov264-Pinguiococcus_pyrenoidosus.AAC.5